MGRLEVRDLSIDVPGRRLLDEVSFAANAGECLAFMGPSGSGKTSLLHCICGISVPASGSVWIDGMELTSLSSAKRSEFRLQRVGMVFQFGELLAELTALENVALPLRLSGVPRHDAEERAGRWLERIGLAERFEAHSTSLSGGEVQRIGIARALAHEPRLVLADEPTGALDESNTENVTELLIGAAKELGATVIITTHDPMVAAKADKVFRIRGGCLIPDEDHSSLGQLRP